MFYHFTRLIIRHIYCTAIILTGISSLAFGQKQLVKNAVQKPEEKIEERIFLVVEKQPEFPGGPDARKKFLSKNIVKPKLTPGVHGRVWVSFVVNADGSLQGLTVVKSLHPDYDKEALRVIGLMPKWVPGMQSGKALRVKYVLPIEFH